MKRVITIDKLLPVIMHKKFFRSLQRGSLRSFLKVPKIILGKNPHLKIAILIGKT